MTILYKNMQDIDTETIHQSFTTFDENGVLKDCLICGNHSDNGYDYSLESFQEALEANKYENAGVFLDHPEVIGGKPADRKGTERLGILKNVHLSPEGLRADYHAITSHPMYEIIKEDFEKGLGGFSFSHVAKTIKRDGKVVEIEKVYEVDICTTPNGTTTTLLETKSDDPNAESEQLCHNSLMMAIESCVKDVGLDTECKKAKIMEHLDHHFAVNAKEEDEKEVKEETLKETLVDESGVLMENLKQQINELKKITELQSKYFTSPMSVPPVEMVEGAVDHMEKLRNSYRN